MPKNKYKKENILQASTLNKQHKYHISTIIREIGEYEKKTSTIKTTKNDLPSNAMVGGKEIEEILNQF